MIKPSLPYLNSSSNSPYLKGASSGVVNWHTWCKEAIELAGKENKPIFISMGFVSSYMCTKMDKECFADKEVAAILNEHFICIKLDKEENPLVHQYLLSIAQILIPQEMTWPINLFLTPHLLPFFGVCYMPKETQGKQGGFLQVLTEVLTLYQEDLPSIEEQGHNMVEFYSSEVIPAKNESAASADHIKIGQTLFPSLDPLFAGIRGPHKFPLSYQMLYLINYGLAFEDVRSFFFIKKTLEAMRTSPLKDSLYGGYFSFAHDEKWEKPYYEKSLVVNAMIGRGLVHFIKQTNCLQAKQDLISIISFIVNYLKVEGGGFASSASSLDEERGLGASFKASRSLIENVLDEEEVEFVTGYFSIPHLSMGQSGSHLVSKMNVEQWALEQGYDPLDTESSIKSGLHKIRENLSSTHPLKIDTRRFLGGCSHVALVLFQAGQLLDKQDCIQSALDTLNFIDEHLVQKGIFFQYVDEQGAHNLAGFEDLTAYLHTLLEIFQTTKDNDLLEKAKAVLRCIDTYFYQGDLGLYFCKTTPLSIEVPLVFEDLTTPSAQAMWAHNLLMLYQIEGDEAYLKQAERIICALLPLAHENPWAYTYLLYVSMLYEQQFACSKLSAD